jgi:hypothetical protein
MGKTDQVNSAIRALVLLFVLGGSLFWAVFICVGLFEPHLGWGERVAFIVGAPFVFAIMAIVGGPSLLVAMLSADDSGGQSTQVKQLAEAAVLCGPLSVARYLWLAALLREARSVLAANRQAEPALRNGVTTVSRHKSSE